MAVPDAYRGREQTFVKHTLLRNYLDKLGHKVGSRWDCINFVDCFAGPWQSSESDFGDTSFGIAVDTLSKAQQHIEEIGKKLRLRFCLIESDKPSFEKLRGFAESRRSENVDILALQGEFEQHLNSIESFLHVGGSKAFRFLLIDPKGWTGFALKNIAPLVECRSAEILVNIMTSHIRRFVAKEAHAEQFEELFGDATVVTAAASLRGAERESVLVQKYAENLKASSGLSFTSTAAVLRAEQDSVHYYLVFGTNSPHGVQVFKEAEQAAFELGESAREEAKSRKRVARTGQTELFIEGPAPPSAFATTLRMTYLKQAKATLQSLIRTGNIEYDKVLGEVLQTPLVWKADLDDWLSDLAESGQIRILPELGRKKLRLSQSYRILALVAESNN